MTKTDRQKKLAKFEKACESAAKKREANRELRQQYREDAELRHKMEQRLIKDLKRVFNHADNPFAGWAASQKRYRQLGHYPEIMVTDLFGTHAEFERAAGLRALRTTQKTKNTAAKIHTERNIRRFGEESVMSTADMWKHAYNKRDVGVKHIAVGSDFHGQMMDPFAARVWFSVLKLVQPDGVIFNGDVVDFAKVSRYSVIPGAGALSCGDEIRWTREHIFAPTRKICPKAWMTFHVGNHEQRLVRYLADSAPALSDISLYDEGGNEIPLRWDTLFGTKKYEIEMVFGGNWLAPTQKDRTDNIKRTYRVYYDCFAVSHGRSIAKNAPEEELRRFGLSGTSGHTHRPSVWTTPTLANPFLSWTSTGMMAGFAVGKDYVDGPSAWTMGFSIFTVDTANGIVVPQPVHIYEDFATFAGHTFRPTEAERKLRLEMWGENGHVTRSARKRM